LGVDYDSEGGPRSVKEERKGGAPRGCHASDKGERVDDTGALNTRRRKEAILIKVEEDRDWIAIYKRTMAVKNTIEGDTGMRKTRAGHILIEFDRRTVVSEAAEKFKAALIDATEVAALANMATLQIKNLDLLTTKEELVEDLRREWEIRGMRDKKRRGIERTLVSKVGLVGIKVEDTFCISGYCFPNVSRLVFEAKYDRRL
jgi:hypothetical protein